jgi:hypothetical protein
VECRHEEIHVKRDLDINASREVLAFTMGSKILQAKHGDQVVTKGAWTTLVAEIKAECAGTLLLCSNHLFSEIFALHMFLHFKITLCAK